MCYNLDCENVTFKDLIILFNRFLGKNIKALLL